MIKNLLVYAFWAILAVLYILLFCEPTTRI